MTEPAEARTGADREGAPSLLRALLFDHLDPGYAAAARKRAERAQHPAAAANGDRPSSVARRAHKLWVPVGALAIGVLLGVAGAQAAERAPDVAHTQSTLASDVRREQAGNDQLARDRARLATAEQAERERVLAGDSRGRELLASSARAQQQAAATAVHGPGLTVVLSDPSSPHSLSDASRPGQGAAGEVVLDRDLQSVVNALWASGAEAISVDGIRMGPGVTVRQAGGAMLVDNQPVSSPYTVAAIGPPAPMHTGFVVSPAYLRAQTVHQLYGVGLTVAESRSLTMPAAPVRTPRYARPEAPR